jgi:hypothetical protein
MTEPRSGDVTVGGVPWLARMIDKARLDAEGTIDQFDLEYPCPMDQSCLSRLGVDAEVFQQIAVTASSDDQVLKQLRDVGAQVPQ